MSSRSYPPPTPPGAVPINGWVRVRLPVDDLRIGMRVVHLDRPWTEVPLLFQNFPLESSQQLDVLRQHCLWVVADVDATQAIQLLHTREDIQVQTWLNEPPVRHSLQEELPRARNSYQKAQVYVGQVLQRIASGNTLNLDDALPVIKHCVTSIMANPNAMFWLTRIRHQDEYTAEHCLRVAVMAAAFGRFLDLPRPEVENLGLCGLLHDIGKMKVAGRILNKPGALNAQELAEMRRHPEYGADLLSGHHRVDAAVIEAALYHHERLDGSGYPKGLQDREISRNVRIVTIVDAYDAITSDRCYRKGRSPAEALRILYRERGRHFDPRLTETFIRMIGIYPPGSLVELNTGEIAVVHASNPNQRLRPRIEILMNAQHALITGMPLDLAENPLTPDGKAYEINQTLSDGVHGVQLEQRIRAIIQARASSALP